MRRFHPAGSTPLVPGALAYLAYGQRLRLAVWEDVSLPCGFFDPRSLGLCDEAPPGSPRRKAAGILRSVLTGVCWYLCATLPGGETTLSKFSVQIWVEYPPTVQLPKLVSSVKGVSAGSSGRSARPTLIEITSDLHRTSPIVWWSVARQDPEARREPADSGVRSATGSQARPWWSGLALAKTRSTGHAYGFFEIGKCLTECFGASLTEQDHQLIGFFWGHEAGIDEHTVAALELNLQRGVGLERIPDIGILSWLGEDRC